MIPASVDFTTSESMKLAKEFDPQCHRQLIAASKIDKYDKGIAEKLLGRGPGAMQLKLGCVAVLNRNQDEIDQNISFEEMKQREAQFFIRHHEAFQHVPNELKGIDQLVKRLAIIQQERIRSTLPQVIDKLRKQIREKKLELKSIPIAQLSEQDCWIKFQSMINELRESIRAKVNGDYDMSTRINMFSAGSQIVTRLFSPNTSSLLDADETSIDSLPGDDRIAYHVYRFQRKFQDELSRSFSNFFSADYYKLVLQAIDDAAGVSLPNFPSYQIIERLFRAELERLPKICFTLIERIRDYLKKSLLRILEQTFDSQYVRLLERLKDVLIKQIDAADDRANERINEILEMEIRIFTMNHQYMMRVEGMKKDYKILEAEHRNKASPPPFATTVLTPAVKEVTPKQTISPTTNSSFDSNLKPQVLTTTVLTMPMILPNLSAPASDDALAATDIQMGLDSYSLVNRLKTNHLQKSGITFYFPLDCTKTYY